MSSSVWMFARGYLKFTKAMMGIMAVIVLAMVFSDLVGMSKDYLTIWKHKHYWQDVNEFASGNQSLEQLQQKYGKTFTHMAEQAFWMFYPSEKTITFRMNMNIAVDRNIRSDLLLMVFIYFLFHFAIKSMAVMYCRSKHLNPSFFTSKSWGQYISFLLSTILVYALSWMNAYFEQKNFHIPLKDLALIYFVLSYTSALWFLAIKYIIDCHYITKEINPHHTFRDDIIALTWSFFFLLFFGNSFLSIISEMVAGVAPFLFFKMMICYSPSLLEEKQTKESTANAEMNEYGLAFCWMMFMITLVVRLFFVDSMLTDSIEAHNKYRYEIWSKKIWNNYLEEKFDKEHEKYLRQIALSEDPEDLNTLAAIYAWRKNKETAEALAKKALPETSYRVKLLLEGRRPKEVEIEVENKKQKIREEKQMYKTLNTKLWNIYKYEKMQKLRKEDLQKLAKSQEKHHMDTLAAIYAWRRNKSKAIEFSAKTLPQTKKRVALLLRGLNPREVERMMRK